MSINGLRVTVNNNDFLKMIMYIFTRSIEF